MVRRLGEDRHPADNGGSVSYLKTMGAGYSLQFGGTRVSVESRTTPSSGISEVRIDGVLVGRIDGYSASTLHRQTVFVSPVLPVGTHTISVTATSEKNSELDGSQRDRRCADRGVRRLNTPCAGDQANRSAILSHHSAAAARWAGRRAAAAAPRVGIGRTRSQERDAVGARPP